SLPGLALCGARGCDIAEVALELLHAPHEPAPVDLELRLTGSATGADTAGLLTQLQPAPAQSRQSVTQLRELALDHALLTRRVLGEDVEDQRGPVDDVDTEDLLEVALLCGRELVVEHDEVDVERVADLLQFLRLALADVRRRIGRGAPLQHAVSR